MEEELPLWPFKTACWLMKCRTTTSCDAAGQSLIVERGMESSRGYYPETPDSVKTRSHVPLAAVCPAPRPRGLSPPRPRGGG